MHTLPAGQRLCVRYLGGVTSSARETSSNGNSPFCGEGRRPEWVSNQQGSRSGLDPHIHGYNLLFFQYITLRTYYLYDGDKAWYLRKMPGRSRTDAAGALRHIMVRRLRRGRYSVATPTETPLYGDLERCFRRQRPIVMPGRLFRTILSWS